MVTTDEAYVHLNYCNGERRICHVKCGETVSDKWLVKCTESWPIGFMIVGGLLAGRGRLHLLRVPEEVKVNAE